MAARKYPSVQSWAHRRIVEVDLDADLKVDFRLPDLGVWIAQGRIPNPLRNMAENIEYGLVNPEQLSDEDRQAYYDLQAFIVATHLVKPNLIEELGSQEAAMDWVRNEMPPTHRDLIWLRAFHIVPADIAGSLTDLFPFRDEPAGDGAEPDSSAQRASTE